MKLEFEVKQQVTKLLGNNVLVADSKNYVYAHFDFTEEWSELVKTVFFKQGDSVFITLVLDQNDSCLVPKELLAVEGNFTIHVVGSDNVVTITTNPLKVFVKGNDIITGDNTGTPTVDFLTESVTTVKKYRDEAEGFADETKETKAEAVAIVANIKESETNAATSATAAKVSETNSAQSATTAGSSVITASAAKTAAANSAAAAKTSETNAANAATAAGGSADSASASAAAAVESKIAAASSENNADTFKNLAHESSTAAADSATTATTEANRAKTEADRAVEAAKQAAAGGVRSVDGISPDADGNVNTKKYVHPESGVQAGTYKSVTVDAQGHITEGSNPNTLAGYGITDAQITGGMITLGVNTITPLTAGSAIDASKLTGVVKIENLPPTVIERIKTVEDDAARFALTTATVQNGDSVKVVATNLMYYVKDDTKLGSEDGYEVYTAGAAASVPWSGVTGLPATFAPSAHNHKGNEITLTGYTKATAAAAITATDSVNIAIGKLEKALDGKQAAGSYALAEHSHNVMTGASASAAGTAGFVPAPAVGQQNAFLGGDGTWKVPLNNKVTQEAATTTDAEYPLLLAITANQSTNTTDGVRFAPSAKFNPVTKTLTLEKFKGALIGNAYTATKATQDAAGNNIATTYATKQELANKADKATTLAGYGIADAKIAGNTITLGSNTITPLTQHQDLSGYAQLNSANTFTAFNTFRKNIAVSNGTAAGSQGQIILGVKPSTATVQANIMSSTTGALNYNATEATGHYFRIGNNTASTSITTNNSETAILSHNAFEFAKITNVGVAKWLGNANTATKLETARTINGVAFDGTKDIIVGSNPVGTIIAVAYTGVPEGYMHCNGAAVNRTTYVNLFNKIGTTYGAGDGSTTFDLPNINGEQPPAMTAIYCIKY